MDKIEELKNLNKLFNDNLVSKEEFEALKKEILNNTSIIDDTNEKLEESKYEQVKAIERLGIINEDKVNLVNEYKAYKESEEPKFKMSNEYGIAGFIFSLLLPFQMQYINSPFINKQENDILIYTIVLFYILSLILSFLGVSKNSEYYQKGLANWGLFFNIVNLIQIFPLIFH